MLSHPLGLREFMTSAPLGLRELALSSLLGLCERMAAPPLTLNLRKEPSLNLRKLSLCLKEPVGVFEISSAVSCRSSISVGNLSVTSSKAEWWRTIRSQ